MSTMLKKTFVIIFTLNKVNSVFVQIALRFLSQGHTDNNEALE